MEPFSILKFSSGSFQKLNWSSKNIHQLKMQHVFLCRNKNPCRSIVIFDFYFPLDLSVMVQANDEMTGVGLSC